MDTKIHDHTNGLTEYKIPFVLRDLEMGFSAGVRERNSLDNLKNWQIIVTSGLITLVSGNKDISPYFSLVILLINIVMIYLETGIKWNIYLIGKRSGEQEKLLEVKTVDKFEENINNWNFGTGLSDEYYFKSLRQIFSKKILCNKSTLLWNILFIVISFLPLIIRFLFT
jgi:hypothetical protein